MSPARGRKRSKTARSGQRVLRVVGPAPEACDCPACSGSELDPLALVDDLVAGGAELLETDDPLEAELFAAGFLAAGELAGEDFAEALAEGIVPAVAQQASPESLAVLLALVAVDDGPAAADAARRLLLTGVPAPTWAEELRIPATVGRCRRFADPAGRGSMLVCSFERSGRSHGFVVNVDHTDCHAAVDILLFPGEVIDEVVDSIKANARGAGVALDPEVLAPAEFRWQVDRALDARAVHDRESDEPELAAELGDEDGPGYHLLATLLRARMRELPEPPRPPAPHGEGGLPGH